MSHKNNIKNHAMESDQVEQLAECLFELNQSVSALKQAIKKLTNSQLGASELNNALSSEEINQLTPKRTLH